MERYVAFLRAINVGGHTVKMDYLRQVFESFGLSGVETFIASGNVVFEAPTADARALDEQIGQGLREALGYDVATFCGRRRNWPPLPVTSPFHSQNWTPPRPSTWPSWTTRWMTPRSKN